MASRIGHNALDIVRKYHPGVEKVIDAKKPATFVVNEEDCKQGRSKEPGSCALARSIGRQYDGAIVSLSTAYVIKGKTAYRYHVPQSISRELVSFDRSHVFSPGTYSLKAINKSAALGKRRHPQKPRKGAGGSKYRNDKPRSHRTTGIRSL